LIVRLKIEDSGGGAWCPSWLLLLIDRLKIEDSGGGAWCPSQPISRTSYEWLEIDLQGLKVITQIETQGRYGLGQVRCMAWGS